MQLVPVRNLSHGTKPHLARRGRLGRTDEVQRLHAAKLERPRLLHEAPHPLAQPRQQLRRRTGRIAQGLGRRHGGHLDLVLESVLDDLERGCHVEDGRAVLNRHHAPV